MNPQKSQQHNHQGTQQKVQVTHAQFNEIDPTFANRIFEMAEREQRNRHINETMVTKNVVRMSLLGVVFAFLSVLIMSGLVFYSLWKGYSQTAGAIAVGAVAAVASVFIFFRRRVKEKLNSQ